MDTKGTRRFLSLGIAALGLFSAATRATSFSERPFEESINEASVIVRGQVGMSYAEKSKIDSQIYTYVQLEVTEVFRGEVPSRHIVIREYGGTADGVSMQVSGSAPFVRGEDVVVLLSSQARDESYPLQGLMMGKLKIKHDPKWGEVLDGPALVLSERHQAGHPSHEGITHPGDTSAHAPLGDSALWSLARLRAVSQGKEFKGNSQQATSALSQKIDSKATPVPDQNPAPELQNPAEREKQRTSWVLFGSGLAFVLVSAVVISALRSK